jgi:hypothetical protein
MTSDGAATMFMVIETFNAGRSAADRRTVHEMWADAGEGFQIGAFRDRTIY